MNHTIDLAEDFFSLKKEYLESVKKHYKNNNKHKSLDELGHIAMSSAIKIEEAMHIAEILQYLKPKKILEIGSYLGFSSRWILEITKEWQAELTSIDPDIEHQKFDNIREHFNRFCAKYQTRVKTINAFSCFDLDGYKHIPIIKDLIGEFDFAFIDGNHFFKYVFRDTELAAKMLTKGGVIVGHDAFHAKEVIPATELLIQKCPLTDYVYTFGIEKLPIGFPLFYFKSWNQRRITKKRLLEKKEFCDGLTIVNIPKNYKPATKIIEIVNYLNPQNSTIEIRETEKINMINRRDEFLKTRELKTSIKKQLRKWGYKQK